jgi:DCN1-like protein 1/2
MAWGVAPEAQRPALGAGASTSGDPGLAPEEAAVRLLRDLLAAFFQAYLEDAPEVRKPQMSRLLAQAHQHGLVGARVLPALAALHDALRPELDAGPEKFAAFYHFVFFVARERGDRNLRAEAATRAWAFALAGGRFNLLERFCAFVRGRILPRGVSEDTWCQVLDFANAARAFASAEDAVAAYDPRGAWPVLVDEFVDHLRGGVSVPVESQSTSQSASQSSPQEDRWRVAGWARRDRDSGFSPPDTWDSAMDASARSDAAVYTGGGAGGAGQGFGRYDRAGPSGGGGSLTGVGAAANPEWGGGGRRRAERRGRRGGAPAAPPGAGGGRGVQAPPERGAGDGWARHAAREAGARGVSRVRRPGRRRARSVDVPGYPAARLRRAEPGHGVADAKVRARRFGAPRDVDDAKRATRASLR